MQLRLKKLGVFLADKHISFRNTSAKDGTLTPLIYDTETNIVTSHSGAFEKTIINLNVVPVAHFELEPVVETTQ